MNVFCYFHPISGLTPRNETLELWKASWAAMGFTPHVLDENYARRNPRYPAFSAAIRRWPSVNPPGFDYHALMRWLAVGHAGGGLSTEPDVINYGLRPDVVSGFAVPDHALACLSPVPAMLLGTQAAYYAAADAMESHRIKPEDNFMGKRHLSDQDFAARYLENKLMVFHRENPLCKEVFQPGWNDAPCVHYGTPYMEARHMRPKHEWIQILRPHFSFHAGWNKEEAK